MYSQCKFSNIVLISLFFLLSFFCSVAKNSARYLMVVSPTWFQFGGDIEAVAEKLNSGISSNFV